MGKYGERIGRLRRAALIAAALYCAVVSSSCGFSGRAGPPRALHGIMDLRSWDFGRDGPVTLSGEWAFVPLGMDGLPAGDERFREVPDLWKGSEAGAERGKGYASYRLTVLLPAGHGPLHIRNTTMATAFSLYAQGRLIDEAGRAGASPGTAIPAYDPGEAPVGPAEGELSLEARVSNWEYREGGMWHALVLGEKKDIQRAKRYSDIATYILFGVLVAMGSNSIVHFIFRRKDKSHLYFGLFVLDIALRTIVTGEYVIVKMFESIPFSAVIRLEYFTAITAPALFTLYYGTFYPFALPKRWRLALSCLAAPFVAALPFLPLAILTRTVYGIYGVLIVQAASISVVHFWKVFPRRRWESIALALGGVALFASVANDILFATFRLPTFDMVPLGLAAFVFAQALVQARRTDDAFSRAEILASELGDANGLLQEELRANDEARKSLEALVSEKDLLIREVNHRVKNSLQVVSSIIALQERRSEGERERGALAALGARIRAIGLVHEMLYGAVSADRIDLGSFLRELVGLLERSYGSDQMPLEIASGLGNLLVPVDFCVDTGLILNELVSNACKHGQAGGACPKISVSLRGGGGRVELEIRDDGKGFPPGFDPERAAGLGFTVARTLARRRGGSLSCRNDPGTGGAVVELGMSVEDASEA